MYLGHLSLALVAKRVRPDLPLWLLAVATVWMDAVVVALLIGQASPGLQAWAHCGVEAVGWGVLSGALAGLRYDRNAGLMIGGLVFLHLPGDWLTGQFPLWPGSPAFGLHLYAHRPIDFALELAVILGCWTYYRAGLPWHQRTRWPVWGIAGMLIGLQAYFDFAMTLGA